jgi:acyl-coenzyme A thioesterase PaaI-like protein
VTPHLGNRVAHVHGGVLLGAAASVASAAVPARMRLSNISSWFVSPGLPPRLEVRSEVLQHGRNLAVVRTQILGASGKLVLETTSQHIASARGSALPR